MKEGRENTAVRDTAAGEMVVGEERGKVPSAADEARTQDAAKPKADADTQAAAATCDGASKPR